MGEKLQLIAGPALSICILAGTPVAAADWQFYQNSRFGTSAEVPAHFAMGEAPGNNDGRRFDDPDGKGSVSVYGSYNAVAESLEGYRRFLIESDREEGWDVTYQPKGPNWFVQSGVRDGMIFYRRVEHAMGCSAETLHHIYFHYPVREKTRWDAIVAHGAHTLDGPCADE